MSEQVERRLVLHLGSPERKVLTELLDQLAGVIAPPPTHTDPLEELVGITTAQRPDDPAVLRLFPDGYGTPDEAAEFRRYTEGGLRQAKADSLATMRESLGTDPVEISMDQATAWLRTLNDLRLFLGTRLDVTADHDEVLAIAAADPDAYSIYEFLGWLQQSLLEEITDA